MIFLIVSFTRMTSHNLVGNGSKLKLRDLSRKNPMFNLPITYSYMILIPLQDTNTTRHEPRYAVNLKKFGYGTPCIR